MNINPIFRHNIDNLQISLHEDLFDEVISIFGIEVKYLPSTMVKFDKLFGEDVLRKFERAYTIPVYLNATEGFDGRGYVFDKFGLGMNDSFTFTISKRAFIHSVPDAKYSKPNEGDLVFEPTSGKLFEIKFVEREKPFYTNGSVPCWQCICETVKYNQEEISTGDDKIDSIARDLVFTLELVLRDGSGAFTDGEIVIQESGNNISTGVVNRWNPRTHYLKLEGITNDFISNVIVFGQTSGAEWNVESVIVKSNDTPGSIGDNDTISAEANVIVDWTESNPFGTF